MGRRNPRLGAQAAHDPSRATGDQGRSRAGGLAAEAGQAQTEGPGRALDGQDYESQAAPGRDPAGRSGDPGNTASDVWADGGYRSKKNEELLRQRMLVSRIHRKIHRKKPAERPMPPRTAGANARKSAVRADIEHVFAEQKARMGLFVRTIGLARATTKIGRANLVYNIRRLLWLDRRPAFS